jgi:hypothetical protein
VYYIARLRGSLAGFDGGQPLQQMMGEGAYKNYMKAVAEIVTTTEVTIYQFVPAMSNPPADVAAAAPNFWNPKPPPPPKAAGKAPAKKQ